MIAVDVGEGRIKLDLFEGPLDLLLYLIRKNEIDIHDIPIATITEQYQGLLDHAREQGLLDLDFAGDYFLMAATLIQIKTKMLLPRPDEDEEIAPEDDPRTELVQQLLEYERYREAALMLRERGEVAGSMFPRPDEAVPELQDGDSPLVVDLLALARAFRQVLNEKRLRTPHVYEPSRYTVRDRIQYLLRTLEAAGGPTNFATVFEEGSVEEAVVTFLALLELVKRGAVRCQQEEQLGAITLEAVPEDERPESIDALAESEFDLDSPSGSPLDQPAGEED